MNKQEFVDLLRQPESISKTNLTELEELVSNNPYFHSAHTVIAKAARLTKDRQAAKRIGTAAIYTTSRKALKKYIQGEIAFTETKTSIIKETVAKPKSKDDKKKEAQIPKKAEEKNLPVKEALPKSEHDALIDEVYENIKEWEKSRNMFLEYELTVEETDTAVDKPEIVEPNAEDKASVDKIKSQIAEEIIAEEEDVEEALKEISKAEDKPSKEAKEDTDKVVDEEVETIGEEVVEEKAEDENSSEELLKINKEKENLKLSPGGKGGKKFRLNILNRPTSKTKATTKKTTVSKTTRAKADTETKKSTTAKPTSKASTTKAKTPTTPAKKTTASKATTRKTTTTKKATSAKSSTTRTTAAKKTTSTKATSSKAASTAKKAPAKKTTAKSTATKSTTTRAKKTGTEDGEKKKPRATVKSPNSSQNEIIDQFLENNPSISKGSASLNDENNVDLSENSTIINKGIITENMARIYESQGKNEKAIAIYEELILKNPEKKSYFASRIENLNNQ